MCHGVELVCALGTLRSRRTNDQYVDDDDGWNSAPETNKMPECARNLRDSAQKSAKLVSITGGLMSFHKVNWQAMAFIAVAGFYLMQSSINITEEVILRDDKDQYHKIPRIRPNADQNPEFDKRLRKQAKECAGRAASAHPSAPSIHGLV